MLVKSSEDLLDALSLVSRVPISIRHIDVAAPGRKFHRRYITLPYGQHTLTEADLKEAQIFQRDYVEPFACFERV